MSSLIAVPRIAVSGAASSTSTSPTGLYVPVHKRREASQSPSSSRSPSPTLSTSSWRTHTPSKDSSAAFRKHRKSPSNTSSTYAASNESHIPKHSMIPASTLPHTYSIHTLLSLSSRPAPLSPEQEQGLRSHIAVAAAYAASDKAATRRRRTGRKAKNTAQPLPKAALQTADVETRRTRHGHGTWGWQPQHAVDALKSHHAELELSWRHSAAVAVVA